MGTKMALGYITKYDLELNPHLDVPFKYKEYPFSIRINSRGKKIYSKGFYPLDYDEVVDDTEMLRKMSTLMLIKTPIILDDELRDRMKKWVEWANASKPSAYELFAEQTEGGQEE